jgi:hypothetical protein
MHPPAWLCILMFVVLGVLPCSILWILGNKFLNNYLADRDVGD